MLSDVRGGEIEPLGQNRFMGLKTGFQGFVTNTCGFLDGDLVRPTKEGDWRIYRDELGLRAPQRKRKVKFSATIRQAAISKVPNGRFIVIHAVS
jgi:hypothetical protein